MKIDFCYQIYKISSQSIAKMIPFFYFDVYQNLIPIFSNY